MVSVETNEYPQVYIPLLIDFALMRIMAHGLLCFVWTLDKVYELQEPRLAFMSQFKNNKLSEWWVITIFLTAAFCIIILNVYFRSSWIMIKVIKVILMVMLMVYSADTLNEKVIKEIWRHHSPLLEEFLRRVKVTPHYTWAFEFWLWLDKIFFQHAHRLTTGYTKLEALSSNGCRKHRLARLVKELKYVDRLCEDCYNLFRQDEVYSLCRLAKM